MLNKVFPWVQRFVPGIVNSNMKLSYLRSIGLDIGAGTVLFDARNVVIDSSRPALLKIGEYCKITGGVEILTHDYSRAVLRMAFGEVIGEAKQTIIGNNVFIGVRSIILMGTQIGDNSIVGAGSVCSGKYPSNSVIAGNPAKVISTLDDYYKKRKGKYVYEAKDYCKLFLKKYSRYPSIEEMGAFFPIYLERTKEALGKNHIRTKLSGDVEKEIIDNFLKSKPLYKSYESFLDDI